MNEKFSTRYDEHGNEKPYRPRPEKNNIPPFMRRSVSDYFIRNNPRYAKVFQRCPSCGKNGLKPININNLSIIGKKCAECGYINDTLTNN